MGFLVHLRTAKENAMHHLEMSQPFWVAATIAAWTADFEPSLSAFQAMYIMGGEL